MSDGRVRKDYPEPVENPEDKEGDDGNPGVPSEYLDQLLNSENEK